MAVRQDRDYWRVMWWDDENWKRMDEYFGKDKATALAHAMAICDIKIEKWQKRKQEYFQEYKQLMSKVTQGIPE